MLKVEFQTQTKAWPGDAGTRDPRAGGDRPMVVIKTRSRIKASDPEMLEQAIQEITRQQHELAHRLALEAMEHNAKFWAEYAERCNEYHITPVLN